MNDSILKFNGMEALIDKLGEVDTERFIAQLIKNPFDYTKFHTELYKGKSSFEIAEEASKYYQEKYSE